MVFTTITFATLLPLLGAIFCFSFGLFLWWKNRQSLVFKIFFAFCIAVSIWLFGTFQMFLARDDVLSAIWWDRFVYIGVVFIPSLMHHFSLAITNNKRQRKLLYFSYAFSFIFLLISRTEYFVAGLNVFPKLVHTQARIGHHIFLVLFFSISSLMFYNLFVKYRSTKSKLEKKVLIISALAFANILLIGGTAYLPAYGIDICYPFSYFSGIIFVVILAFAVSKQAFLSSRVITSEISVLFLVLVISAHIFMSEDYGEFVFNILTLGAAIFFGIELVHSTRREIEKNKALQQLAAELAAANTKLEERDQMRGEFISMASHQLRTPVSVMKGYISLMLDGTFGKIPVKIKDKLHLMFEMNERLVLLVNNMLNASRIEKNRIDFGFDEVQVDELGAQVIDELKYKAEQKSLKLKLKKFKGKLPAVVTDPEKIREIMVNLVDNSIKYTIEGSVEMGFDVDRTNEHILVYVKDTGHGMTEEDAKHVFEKFFRAEMPNVPREHGTGLGLYIVTRFLRGMGGDIWISETAPGKGTTFMFTIPFKPPQKVAQSAVGHK